MMRAFVVAAAMAVTVAAVAAEDPITVRKALMKATGKQAGVGAAMIKGEAPFDLAKAKAIFVAIQDTAAKAPTLFPVAAKDGDDTAALPAIWQNKADFEARFTKLGVDAKAAEASVTDLASFKTAFSGVGKDCGGCHENYRLKK
ncbi:MAG: c-type cytochrome [Xanthobacteraceae bacterium]